MLPNISHRPTISTTYISDINLPPCLLKHFLPMRHNTPSICYAWEDHVLREPRRRSKHRRIDVFAKPIRPVHAGTIALTLPPTQNVTLTLTMGMFKL